MARRKQAWSGWGGSPMHRVAGWDFDHRLNGYITTAADTFSCDCGQEFHTPSGYRKCGSCGRAWNSYVIGTDSHGKEAALEKVIVREIPVRKDVIVASRRRAAPKTPRMKPENVMVDSPSEQKSLSDFVNNSLSTAENPYDPWQREMAHRGLQWNWGQGSRGTGYEGPGGEFQPDMRPRPYSMSQLTYPGHERDQYIDYAESRDWHERSPYHQSTPYAKELAQWRAANPHPEPRAFKSDVGDLYDSRRAENPNMAFSRDEKFHNYHQTLKNQGLKYQDIAISGGSGGGYIPPDDWSPGDDLNPYVMPHRRKESSRRQAGPPPQQFCNTCNRPDRFCKCDAINAAAGDESDEGHFHELKARRQAARRYVAWCRQVGRMPNTAGLRRFRTAERLVRLSDRHELRRRDLRELEQEYKESPEEDISIEHFSSRRAAGEWNKNPDKGFDKSWPQDDGGWDIPKKKKRNKDFDGPDDPMLGFNSLGIDGPRPKGPSPRYYAELFDITKEGETAKGKGRSNTPTMRKNPKKWTEHKQNGQFTKRWN